MRLGLFGGSFDPVHLGHLAIARAALEQAGLDRLTFLPSARNPFKENTFHFNPGERLELLRLAVSDDPRLDVSDWELLRPPPSYTIETVRHFGTLFPKAKLFWLIGSDQLEGLPHWREFPELAQKVTFLCAPRPGSIPHLSNLKSQVPSHLLSEAKSRPSGASKSEISNLKSQICLPASSALKSEISNLKSEICLSLLSLPPSNASSTEVRRRLALGEVPADLLPTRVCQRLQSGTRIGL